LCTFPFNQFRNGEKDWIFIQDIPLKTLKEWEFPKSKRQNGSGLKPKTLGNSWFLIVQYQTSICQQNSTYTRQGLGSSLISPWS
jgi:hypothetical protein